MLVCTRIGLSRRRVAHTAPPARPSTAASPMARSSVLFPDMFEPVTSRALVAPPSATSLRTRWRAEINGCPSPVASKTEGSLASSGKTKSGLSYAAPASELSTRSPPTLTTLSKLDVPGGM